MLNLLLWLGILAGFGMLVLLAWRSAMRRRGFRLVKMLDGEQLVRHAVDVPVVVGKGSGGALARRGTLVLTRKRLAGFTHRSRFVVVRGGFAEGASVRAEGEWLLVRPAGRTSRGAAAPFFRFRLPDADGWQADARKVLRK
jgi:hypothetical protein